MKDSSDPASLLPRESRGPRAATGAFVPKYTQSDSPVALEKGTKKNESDEDTKRVVQAQTRKNHYAMLSV